MSLLESGYELRDSSVLMEAEYQDFGSVGGKVISSTPNTRKMGRHAVTSKTPRMNAAKRVFGKAKYALKGIAKKHGKNIAKGIGGVAALASGIGIGKSVIGRMTKQPHPASSHIANAKAFMGKHGGKVALAGGALAGLSLLRKKNKKNRR